MLNVHVREPDYNYYTCKCIHKENYSIASLRPMRNLCLMLDASPFAKPLFKLVLVGDE